MCIVFVHFYLGYKQRRKCVYYSTKINIQYHEAFGVYARQPYESSERNQGERTRNGKNAVDILHDEQQVCICKYG